MAHIIEKEQKRDRSQNKKGTQMMKFIRKGKESVQPHILDESRNWKMRVDLIEQLLFPEEVAYTIPKESHTGRAYSSFGREQMRPSKSRKQNARS